MNHSYEDYTLLYSAVFRKLIVTIPSSQKPKNSSPQSDSSSVCAHHIITCHVSFQLSIED